MYRPGYAHCNNPLCVCRSANKVSLSVFSLVIPIPIPLSIEQPNTRKKRLVSCITRK